MNIVFPIASENGLESLIDERFGGAPLFLIVDSASMSTQVVENKKFNDRSASCKSDRFDTDLIIDAVVTKCIGSGSLKNLTKQGVKVFQAQSETVGRNLELFLKDALKLFHMFDICQGQKHKKESKDCHHH